MRMCEENNNMQLEEVSEMRKSIRTTGEKSVQYVACVSGSKASSGGTHQRVDDVQHCTVSRCNATHCRV